MSWEESAYGRQRRRTRLISATAVTVVAAAVVAAVALVMRGSAPVTYASVADMVRMNGIDYGWSGTRVLPRNLLDRRIGTIERQLHIVDNGPHVSTRPITTMATVSTVWPKGTAIYSVKGYRSTFRIAAVSGKRPQPYQVDTNPRAHRGADLLDLGGKVRAIDFYDDQDRLRGRLRDPRRISALTHRIAVARLDPDVRSDSSRLFLRFRMRDGTTAITTMTRTPYLSGGILVSRSFYDTVLDVIHHRWPVR